MLEPRQGQAADALDLPDFDDDFETDAASPAHAQPWWRRRLWVVVISVVVLIALIAGTTFAVARANQKPVTFVTQTAKTGTLTLTVSATGPLQSGLYVVNFTGSGKIAEIDVKVGQQVTSGETLAKLDATSLQDALNSAQAQVNSAQTALSNAETSQGKVQAQGQASVNSAYSQEQNTINNTCNKASNQNACIQQAEDQYASSQAQADAQNSAAQGQVTSAQAQLASAQAGLQTAQHNLANAVLTAPHAGVVGAINGSVGGSPGTSASSSSSSGTSNGSSGAFIQIVDLSALQVTANVNEADIGSISQGQVVTFTVSAYAGRSFTGKVSAISPLGQTTSNVVTYPVTIDVDTQSLRGASLLPAMTANVTITTAARPGALLIPASAVTFARQAISSTNGYITRAQAVAAARSARQQLLTLQGGSTDLSKDNPTPAYVLERSQGKWVVKPVVLGLTDGTNYEVLAGLESGEAVVTGQQGGTQATTATGTGAGLGTGGRGTGAGGIFGGGAGGGGRGGAGGGAGG